MNLLHFTASSAVLMLHSYSSFSMNVFKFVQVMYGMVGLATIHGAALAASVSRFSFAQIAARSNTMKGVRNLQECKSTSCTQWTLSL